MSKIVVSAFEVDDYGEINNDTGLVYRDGLTYLVPSANMWGSFLVNERTLGGLERSTVIRVLKLYDKDVSDSPIPYIAVKDRTHIGGWEVNWGHEPYLSTSNLVLAVNEAQIIFSPRNQNQNQN